MRKIAVIIGFVAVVAVLLLSVVPSPKNDRSGLEEAIAGRSFEESLLLIDSRDVAERSTAERYFVSNGSEMMPRLLALMHSPYDHRDQKQVVLSFGDLEHPISSKEARSRALIAIRTLDVAGFQSVTNELSRTNKLLVVSAIEALKSFPEFHAEIVDLLTHSLRKVGGTRITLSSSGKHEHYYDEKRFAILTLASLGTNSYSVEPLLAKLLVSDDYAGVAAKALREINADDAEMVKRIIDVLPSTNGAATTMLLAVLRDCGTAATNAVSIISGYLDSENQAHRTAASRALEKIRGL